MSIWLCKTPSVSFPFSLRTFVEHLSISRPKLSIPRRFTSKAVSTTKINNSSYFETLASRQQDQIRLYVDTLLHWNQRMNLTAVTEVSEVMERHVEDSLAILPHLCDCYASHCKASSDEISVVDVGTGAGLPGMVLAIACPGWRVTLLESMKKRCTFLENVVSVTGLSNVEVVRGRAEDLGHNASFREQFDVAMARAVAEMRVLAEYCLPFVRVGGLFVAAKGHDPQDEIRNAERSIQLMGGSLLKLCSVESHSPYGQRTAVICAKGHTTPRKYPRDPGIPAKLPLLACIFEKLDIAILDYLKAVDRPLRVCKRRKEKRQKDKSPNVAGTAGPGE